MKYTNVILFTGAILLSGACTSKNQVYEIDFNPIPGQAYKYDVTEETRTLVTENGERNNRVNNLALTYDYTLPGSENSPVQLTCNAFSIHQENGTGELFDIDAGTASASTDPGLRMFSAFSGAKMQAKLDENGRIQSISGLKDVYDQMTTIGRVDGENNDGLAYSWQRGYDGGYFAGLVAKGWKLSPGEPVEVGDSWIGTDSLNADPNIQVPTRYTLRKERDGILYIQSDADVDIINLPVPRSVHPGQITIKGKQRGEWQVDALSGVVLEVHTNLTAEGKLVAGEGSIPMHIDSNCTVKKV